MGKVSVASKVIEAWGRILAGYKPVLSIEVTKECPLICPGCYAYNDNHLGDGAVTLRQVSDLKGDALINGIMSLLEVHKPHNVSLIGGEPLVRCRELEILIPRMLDAGVHVQLVTSAVRQIPIAWSTLQDLQICVSIDGLQPEHDARRKPATYERILKNIAGHHITVHCTITRQQLSRPGYLEEFIQFWSAQPAVEKIWISLYTPQKGEVSEERLTENDRLTAVEQLFSLRKLYPKLDMPEKLIDVYKTPPRNPKECIFANITTCLSPDLKKRITPCQFGGTPDCENCGCMASAGFAAIGRHELKFGIRAEHILRLSTKVGEFVGGLRRNKSNSH